MADNYLEMTPAMSSPISASGQMQLLPYISPDQVAQNQAAMLGWQQKNALAQQLMGAPLAQQAGRGGVIANGLTRILGMLQNRNNQQNLTSILKDQFAIENQAAQAKRKQDLEDEYRKLQEEVYKGTQIARGKAQADKEFAKSEFTGGGVFDPATGTFAPNADWMKQQLDLKRAEARIAAANREGPADPFREIKAGVAAGIITPEQAQQAMRAKLMGGGPAPPSGYRATPTGNLEAIPGGPADPATQMNKPQPVSAENRTKLGLLDAAQAALDNYKAQGTDAKGTPHPLANTFTPGNTADTSMNEAISNVLRVESGAAISNGEISAAQGRYAPSALRSDAENKNRVQMLEKKIEAQRAAILQGTNEAPGAGKSAAIPTQTAVNPQTGQRIGLVNGQWVPL